ncbi:PD-(D/E)XK motif protein [Microbacterium sp. STN6]|uniref:PD-(D/E)XK motif protein n=1 Tax=Microbacterium sp. STN6 TaxID=2995588 RepID=UPI002260CF44|nr:PD-(D/E)XK motif protein [Microbacterium sp. STN6]MCX7522589.1 PD-(D/E)XK motif protein [Microbacterium sp. STN6]
MPTYEEFRSRIAALKRPETSNEREVSWVTDAKVIGLSRTHEDRLELFLVGSALWPTTSLVNAALVHGPWWRQGSAEPAFEANRLLLPAAGHFDEIAAFLCTELLMNGADSDLGTAFKKTEPIIRLVIGRLWLSDGALLGLAGELLLIDALCQRADDVAQVVEAWDGWRQSLRDFTWGTTGVEVKTTSGSTSTHQVQGTHQVELYSEEAGSWQESGLILVSIGLKAVTPHANSFTVPMLVDRIVGRLYDASRDDVAEVFLARVREYGTESGFGYDHRTMSHDVSFARSFETNFVRAYDMTDENISVLRRADVTPHQHVNASSLTYSIDLPVRVSGDLNPVLGISQTATAILGTAPRV